MTDFAPPTPEEVAHSRDPKWLRSQADAFELQAHEVAERLRDRADKLEYGLKYVDKQHLLGKLEKLDYQLERRQIKIDL